MARPLFVLEVAEPAVAELWPARPLDSARGKISGALSRHGSCPWWEPQHPHLSQNQREGTRCSSCSWQLQQGKRCPSGWTTWTPVFLTLRTSKDVDYSQNPPPPREVRGRNGGLFAMFSVNGEGEWGRRPSAGSRIRDHDVGRTRDGKTRCGDIQVELSRADVIGE